MSIRILCIDDEPDFEDLIRQKFRKKIRKKEYEISFAQNGLEALEILAEKNNIDLVLSDINMPIMDGITFLENIDKENYPNLLTIVVSAYGDMQNIRAAMNRGAYDFVTKPVDFEDLETTIHKTIEQIKRNKELNIIRQDLDVARKIQLSLIPQNFPETEHLQIYGLMHAARSVGGDLFDVFEAKNGKYFFVIGDVSGKGIPAALFMAISKIVIRSVCNEQNSPSICIKEINDLLCDESVDSMFITLFLGLLDTQTNQFEYCNGGHNPPYIIRANGSFSTLASTNGTALGVMSDLNYGSKTIQLENNDTVFLYTDGVVEAIDRDENEFGEKRVENIFVTQDFISPKTLSNNVLDAVTDFADGQEQFDDITILSFKLT